jgi:antitoxin CptB
MPASPDAPGVEATAPAGDLGRLRWRCRRGMKELDLLLQRWLSTAYDEATAAERAAFEDLLEQPDPQLLAWLFRRERPADPVMAALVDAILADRR